MGLCPQGIWLLCPVTASHTLNLGIRLDQKDGGYLGWCQVPHTRDDEEALLGRSVPWETDAHRSRTSGRPRSVHIPGCLAEQDDGGSQQGAGCMSTRGSWGVHSRSRRSSCHPLELKVQIIVKRVDWKQGS